ncbi:MAG TPA: FAD-dependent oxidoreductase [Ktedonobacteraceae bacterium]|nr:FAD-dependent oxidoreductase [Ktedonobacteraceae bacterium]
MPSIAIIGAGCSGLAAAHVLQDAGYTVTLFEKNDHAGGRATTGKRDGFIYDYGAQYIKGGSPLSDTLITERFRVDDLIDIGKPVWIFDGQGRIQEGDPVQNADPKWTYRSGLSALAQRMAQGLNVRLNTCIERIAQTARGWSIAAASDKMLRAYDQLLITLPANQAAALIHYSKDAINDNSMDWMSNVCNSLRKARYNPVLSVMLGYEPGLRKRPYYALVNTDKAHPISWLAWEHEKFAGRVPEGAGLLIAQMAPQYTLDHWNAPDNEIVEDVQKLVMDLIDEPLSSPVFTEVQQWRYALPFEKANGDHLNAIALPHGLAFCGDGFVGGRVHLALENGIKVARQIIQEHVEGK